MSFRIVSLGEVLWDLFSDRALFGGAPANFAAHAAIQGADVTMLSAVGNDSRGTEALEILRRYGIDTSLVQTVPDVATGSVGVEVDQAGKPTFTIHTDSAWDQIEWTHEIEAQIKTADAVYFGTLGQRSEQSRMTIRRCVEMAREIEIPRFVDINLRAPFYDDPLIRESIRMASILKFSDDERLAVAGASGINRGVSVDQSLRQIRETYDLESLVMTRGAEGAVLVTDAEVVKQQGLPTIVQDTVGAGDSFSAAFLLGLLRNEPYDQLLQQACRTAAEVCAHPGAVPNPR